jgi:putative transcriptional regulator
MSPRFHPSDDRLWEHAAGSLLPGRDLVISAHIANCETCRAERETREAIGGALIDELAPVPLAAGALERALAGLDRPEAAAGPTLPDDWIGFAAPAVAEAWRRRRWAAPGVWVAPVIRGPGKVRTYLLRVGPGMSVPKHRHKGAEFVTVMKGAFDDRGECIGPGDFTERDDAVTHEPRVVGDEECVCLVCTDAPLVPLDWVGKFFQPFVRI